MAAGKRVKEEGAENDLLDRIAADPAFNMTKDQLLALMKPENFTGCAETVSYTHLELKSGDFKNTNSNFSKVKFVIEDGQLEIEKRTVKLTSASANKEYDGTPLTKKDVTESGDGFVKGEGAAYRCV